jgi:hypothetical protein
MTSKLHQWIATGALLIAIALSASDTAQATLAGQAAPWLIVGLVALGTAWTSAGADRSLSMAAVRGVALAGITLTSAAALAELLMPPSFARIAGITALSALASLLALIAGGTASARRSAHTSPLRQLLTGPAGWAVLQLVATIAWATAEELSLARGSAAVMAVLGAAMVALHTRQSPAGIKLAH